MPRFGSVQTRRRVTLFIGNESSLYQIVFANVPCFATRWQDSRDATKYINEDECYYMKRFRVTENWETMVYEWSSPLRGSKVRDAHNYFGLVLRGSPEVGAWCSFDPAP